jgi:hypothetical protein
MDDLPPALCGLLFTSAFSLVTAGVFSDRILSLVYRRRQKTFLSSLFDGLLQGHICWSQPPRLPRPQSHWSGRVCWNWSEQDT